MASNKDFKLPPDQQAIRDKCFHPSGTFVDFPIEDIETSIPARFEKMVAQHSSRVAVKSDNEILTYSEVNQLANRIARALLENRNRQSEPVAVIFDQGVSAIGAILGVLKAGKFYVPLDALFPKGQLDQMLERSRFAFIRSMWLRLNNPCSL